MIKLLKTALLPLAAVCLLLPAAAPARTTHRAAVESKAKERKRDKKKKEADTVRKATPYEKLFQDKEVETVRGGGLTLHRIEDKLYLELPDSLLGRGMMISTTIERTADPGDGFTGQQPVPPYMVEFTPSSSDTLLYLREFAPLVIVEGSPAMREAVERSNIGPIAAACSVKARTPDKRSAVVDLTDLFLGDTKRLRPIDPDGGNAYDGWMTAKADYKKERSMLTGVCGGDACVSVVGELSYATTVSFLGVLDLWTDKPQSILTRRTIRVLGAPERRMRLCDQRIGLAAKAFVRYSDTEQESKTDYFACRRAILDSAGRVRPVVFYVDTTFDASAYAAIERGILLWNDAFAQIGLREVIRVEPFPADPSFNDNALYNTCVRRTGTSNSELHSASWVDPRSGEILGTDIFVPFNFTAAIRKKLLLTLSAADPEARTTRPSPRQTADALTALIARRAAAAFGVMPNYAASAAYPTDSLRSPSFTRRYGLAASITDDVFYNVVAQPGDRERGVKLVADALGPYDYLAVEWLYKPVPGASTPHEELPALRRLLAGKEGDPRYFFAHYASGSCDPRVGTEDLGDDLFKGAAYQLANLKYVAAHGDEWLSGRDGDYKFREELLADMVLRVYSLAEQLMRYVGGVYMNAAYEGSRLPACTAVPREMQRRAVREVLDLSADLEWIDRQGVSKSVYDRVLACEYLQRRTVRTLIEKLRTLDLSVSKSDDPYTADAMARDLTAWIDRRIRSREPLSEHARYLQRSLLRSVVAAANVRDKAASEPASASAFAFAAGVGLSSAEAVLSAAVTDPAVGVFDRPADGYHGSAAEPGLPAAGYGWSAAPSSLTVCDLDLPAAEPVRPAFGPGHPLAPIGLPALDSEHSAGGVGLPAVGLESAAASVSDPLGTAISMRRPEALTPLGLDADVHAAYGYQRPKVIASFKEHLFYGLLLDMQAMYRRGAASAPLADTRDFCRYMADQIDRTLAIE